MGTPLGPKYILHRYMDPLGMMRIALQSKWRTRRTRFWHVGMTSTRSSASSRYEGTCAFRIFLWAGGLDQKGASRGESGRGGRTYVALCHVSPESMAVELNSQGVRRAWHTPME